MFFEGLGFGGGVGEGGVGGVGDGVGESVQTTVGHIGLGGR